ncbi:hypothetical protein [Acidovorax sp. SDU_ACID1]|uniref:hypothetical protein n=1 Tax=Acidovorax sp. SDU_ACID1 TaxID=3136632 RepID=UPI003872F6F6
MHDLGHYPFSHATEHVVKNFYSRQLFQNASEGGAKNAYEANGATTDLSEVEGPMNHEVLGSFIIKEDEEINKVLVRHGKNALEIERIFERSDPENTLMEIISSDLDCDRLDYLKRTAHHTGLPYGSVDTDYLTSQATLDGSGAFAYTAKAARAADHLLVSRYYDYLQVPFNKTVAALEWSLTTAIEKLLSLGMLDCRPKTIRSLLERGTWADFDDSYFIAQFRELYRDSSVDEITRSHLAAILERKPAKTVCEHQVLIPLSEVVKVKELTKRIKDILDEVASRMGVDRARLQVWDLQVDFAKYQISAEDTAAGAVKVLRAEGSTSTPLCLCEETLFGKLLRFSHRGFRVFYLPEDTAQEGGTENVLRELRAAIAPALAVG